MGFLSMMRMEARRRKASVTGQVFKILGQPATSVEPSEGALDNPSFGQDNVLSQLGPVNDFDYVENGSTSVRLGNPKIEEARHRAALHSG